MHRNKQTTLYSFQDWNAYRVDSLTQSWPTLTPVTHAIGVADFKDVGITVIGTWAIANVKVKGSLSEPNMHWLPQNRDGNASSTVSGIPNFGASPSITNQWSYIQVMDIQDGMPLDGNTGIDITALDNVRMFEANTNILSFISFEVVGNVYIQISCYE